MKPWLQSILNRLGVLTSAQVEQRLHTVTSAAFKRGYASAATNRLTSDWTTAVTSGDAELRGSIPTLRARARQLERDDDYVRRFLKLQNNNVLGAAGITLQMRVMEPDGLGGMKPDKQANDKIEAAWLQWGRKRNCTVTRSHSWRQAQKLILREKARDGSALVLVHRGFDNDFRFAIQVLEGDHLDHNLEQNGLRGGHFIRMGVEFNPLGQPVAYHILTNHPGDVYGPLGRMNYRARLPLLDPNDSAPVSCIHLFNQDRASQSDGVTAMVSAMHRLKQLAGYEEAELVAARAAACKMGFLEKDTPESWQGPQDANGNKQMESEPGMIEELPMGMHFKEWDPKHPNTAYPEFTKANLRGAAAGMGVSYTSLANDLEGVNYSSIRAGLLEEREEWMDIQEDFKEDLLDPIFEAWLPMAILSGQLKLPMAKLDKFRAAEWKARRWPWVDPLKDMEAAEKAMALRVKSRRAIITEMGGDEEDTLRDIKAGEELEKAVGLAPVQPANAGKVNHGDTEDTEEDEEEDRKLEAISNQLAVVVNGQQITEARFGKLEAIEQQRTKADQDWQRKVEGNIGNLLTSQQKTEAQLEKIDTSEQLRAQADQEWRKQADARFHNLAAGQNDLKDGQRKIEQTQQDMQRQIDESKLPKKERAAISERRADGKVITRLVEVDK